MAFSQAHAGEASSVILGSCCQDSLSSMTQGFPDFLANKIAEFAKSLAEVHEREVHDKTLHWQAMVDALRAESEALRRQAGQCTQEPRQPGAVPTTCDAACAEVDDVVLDDTASCPILAAVGIAASDGSVCLSTALRPSVVAVSAPTRFVPPSTDGFPIIKSQEMAPLMRPCPEQCLEGPPPDADQDTEMPSGVTGRSSFRKMSSRMSLSRSAVPHTTDNIQRGEASRGSPSSQQSLEKGSADLLDIWKQPVRKFDQDSPLKRSMKRNSSQRVRPRVSTEDILEDAYVEEDEKIYRSTSLCGRLITHPSSFRMFCWNILGILIMLYDTIQIPLQVFDLHGTTFTLTCAKVSLGYWTCDIFCSFVTGFYRRGALEMRPARIAARYAATWMVLDIAVCSLDWAVQILTEGNAEGVGAKSTQVTRFTRAFRSLRVLRAVRILRVLKLKHLMQECEEFFNSEYVHIVLRMCRLIICIAMINHFIACGFYWIGSADEDQDSWVTHLGPATVEYRYTTALHWSLTQFTPASMEIVPRNVAERIYTIFTLLFAMIVFSSFVSSITAAMTRMRELGSHIGKKKQFNFLRWYLKDKSVGLLLTRRITKYLKYAVQQATNHIQESEVELLMLLSEPLRVELKHSIYSPTLSNHPFFKRFGSVSQQAMRQVCDKAAKSLSASAMDVIFSTGEAAKELFFIVSGELLYLEAEKGAYRGSTDNAVLVTPGMWICEAALWSEFIHKGSLYGQKHCDLVVLDSNKFGDVTRQHQTVLNSTRRYADSFMRQWDMLGKVVGDYTTDEEFDLPAMVEECFGSLSLVFTSSHKEFHRPSANADGVLAIDTEQGTTSLFSGSSCQDSDDVQIRKVSKARALQKSMGAGTGSWQSGSELPSGARSNSGVSEKSEIEL